MLSEKKVKRKRNLFFEKSTKTFKDIILNYQKSENKKNKLNNRQLLLKDIESRLKIAKDEEKGSEYIVNEVRKNIKIKNNILNSFGKKALNHFSEANKYNLKIKLDKTKLFNPLFEYNSNISKYSINKNNSKKYNSYKIIKFPKISNSNSKSKLKPLKSNLIDNSISDIKANESSYDNKNELSEFEPNKGNDNLWVNKLIFSNKKNKDKSDKKENNINNCNTSNNISENSKINSSNLFPFIFKTPLRTERNNYSINNKIFDSNFKKNNIRILNFDYLNNIKNIREKLILEEKKNFKYFENNKYGCDKFKIQYNYIKEKFIH